jgi:hypothetical protein
MRKLLIGAVSLCLAAGLGAFALAANGQHTVTHVSRPANMRLSAAHVSGKLHTNPNLGSLVGKGSTHTKAAIRAKVAGLNIPDFAGQPKS